MTACEGRIGTSNGFSLVELLAAVALLSVGALSVVTMQRTSVKQNLFAGSAQTAVALGAQLLESARTVAYKDTRLDATSGFVNPPSSLSPANPLDASGETVARGYTRTWQITDSPTVGGSAAANTKKIEVRVAWSQAGRAEEVVLTTLKAR